MIAKSSRWLHDQRQIDFELAKIGDHPVGRGPAAALEADPAHVFPPGVSVKGPGLRIDGHPSAGGIKIDPAPVGAPGVAIQTAAVVAVDAVVGGAGVGIGTSQPKYWLRSHQPVPDNLSFVH